MIEKPFMRKKRIRIKKRVMSGNKFCGVKRKRSIFNSRGNKQTINKSRYIKILSTVLLRTANKLVCKRKRLTSYSLRGGFLRCSISAMTISNRIDSLIDIFHKTADIDVFSEASKLHKLREYVYKHGSIRWKVYFFRRSRDISH